jgi:hypothetical protein
VARDIKLTGKIKFTTASGTNMGFEVSASNPMMVSAELMEQVIRFCTQGDSTPPSEPGS